MRIVSIVLVALGLVALLAGGASATAWITTGDGVAASIESAFVTNDASSKSAPQQQVTASWAIKDATLLTATELKGISTKMDTIAVLLVAVVLTTAGAVFGSLSRRVERIATPTQPVTQPEPVPASTQGIAPPVSCGG